MVSDQNRLVEGMGSFLGGANSAVDPSLIQQEQYAWAENVVVRDGYPATRPGFKFIKQIPDGVIQAAGYFKNKAANQEELLALIDGQLYSLLPLSPTSAAKNISPAGTTNPYVSQQGFIVQSGKFAVIQDGVSPALIYDGTVSYRFADNPSFVDPTTVIEECVLGANNPEIALPTVSGLEAGMLVISDSGGIQPNSYISSVNISNRSITLNKNCAKTVVSTLKFYSAGTIKDSTPVPVGTIMAFGNGRLWVASGRNLYAGDLIGTSRNSEISFTESEYVTGGGSFFFENPITGLIFLPGPDTSVGQGDLIVFTESDINAVKATNYDRTTWQEISGMQRKAFTGRGAVGQDSIIVTDRDIYFRSLDGLRSLLQTSSGSSSAVSFSDSLEATRLLAFDTERWLKYTPGILFDSRYLVGASPKLQRVSNSQGAYLKTFNVVFSKLIVRDFNAGAVVDTPRPTYDGEWNGIQICKLVEGVYDGEKRCFALTCDPDGKNCLYEITVSDQDDFVKETRTSNPTRKRISCSLETRRFSFNTPFEAKELMRADVGFNDIMGVFSWELKFSPDFIGNFYNVQDLELEVSDGTHVLTTKSPPDLLTGYKIVRSVKPESVCVPGSKRLSNFGYMFQGKISWQGKAKLILFRLHASRKDISDLGECKP